MADVIICLGDVFTENKAVEMMRLRAKKAAGLYRRGRARKIIFTGGFKTRKDLSEARFMAGVAMRLKVPSRLIILEEKANRTTGNAFYSNILMNKLRFRSAIIVTSPHLMKRVKYLFKKIMPDKKLEFISCEDRLGFLDYAYYYLEDLWTLIKILAYGIDYKRM
ncbi:MAG TPA: YdcF family protein [archaeon]|nr:YdcF family protein [archaeon]